MNTTFLKDHIEFILVIIVEYLLTTIIHTGSTSIDRLLGGGIRTGMVTDIYGQSGAGKSQMCFTLCANCARYSKREDIIMFIDTAGTFRPERISEIAGSERADNILNKIMFVRALSTADQMNAIKRIEDIYPRLVIIDTVTALFSNEFKGVTRHLKLMKHLHVLSLAAINFDCAIVITNMVRNIPLRTAIIHQAGHNLTTDIKTTNKPFQQSEFMGTSVSIYTHIKLKLEIVNLERSIFRANLMQPARSDQVLYSITSRGISD
jgi:RecA/RadA recombinase